MDILEMLETTDKFIRESENRFIRLELFPDTPVAFRVRECGIKADFFWLKNGKVIRHNIEDTEENSVVG